MRLYLDEDSDANRLLELLLDAGHVVVSTRSAGMKGASDRDQLRYAAAHALLIVTANIDDFRVLDADWAQPIPHPGILLIHRDDDFRKNMSFAQVVRSVGNLE